MTIVTRARAEVSLLAEIDRLRRLAENHVTTFQARLDAGDGDTIGNSDYGKGLLKATVMAYADMAEKMTAALELHASAEAIYTGHDDV